jgi:peptidoglycan/LPS O-acetylase OafA/YrhL
MNSAAKSAAAPGASLTAARLGRRVAELDGFRAIAIWMVLAGHLTLPPAGNALPRPVLAVLGRGWLGVDLFFVLSGLLITGILLDAREKERFFRNFYGRRFLRIVPLYMAVIALTFLAYGHPASYFLLSALFLANAANLLHVLIPHGAGVFWSLAVEEHFYLAWPCFVRFLTRRNLTVLSLAVFTLTPVLRGVAVAHGVDANDIVYPLSCFRFDGLALGALLAIWIRSRGASASNSLRVAGGMLALSFAIVLIGTPFGVMGSRTIGSAALRYTHMQLLFGSGILASLALSGTLWTSWLRTSFMRVSAELSYCIYLIHLSIFDGYQWTLTHFHVQPTRFAGPMGALILQAVCVLGVTFTLAALSKRYLEDPCLRLRRYFGEREARRATAGPDAVALPATG